ncbi:MAG TPA: response regulator [Elusimicrobiota bacterium]|nr:response regulator [Elusimicrobiota bacterium]
MPGWILLVDDEPSILALLSGRLEMEGYSVTTASDAAQAAIQAESLRPKLVIMDVNMPGYGNGPDAVRAMRAHALLKATPVILFTGMETKELEPLAAQDPLLRVLSKPLNWPLMKKTVEELMGAAPPGGAQAPAPALGDLAAPEPAPMPELPPIPVLSPARAPAAKAPAKKILIADDEENYFQLLRAGLGPDDDIRWAKDGREAIQSLQELSPDILLLDLVLPKVSGLEVLRAMQDTPAKATPVVLLTGAHLAQAQVQVMGKDFPNLRFVIEKPCKMPVLREVTEHLLGRGPAPSSGA